MKIPSLENVTDEILKRQTMTHRRSSRLFRNKFKPRKEKKIKSSYHKKYKRILKNYERGLRDLVYEMFIENIIDMDEWYVLQNNIKNGIAMKSIGGITAITEMIEKDLIL